MFIRDGGLFWFVCGQGHELEAYSLAAGSSGWVNRKPQVDVWFPKRNVFFDIEVSSRRIGRMICYRSGQQA
ncbi:hypothetical protein [Paenibacillus dokdonensis]|uniref:hypothetical protein n=1 Tax=Paenibacillus dokdonensis TaxID=2567944 RepID=UPI003D274D7A